MQTVDGFIRPQSLSRLLKKYGLISLCLVALGLTGCHGHLKHIDGPGHSEDAPGRR